jgi:hypothetical protein
MPLIVAGSDPQTADLQQWRTGTKTVAAIDAHGRLRLGSITLNAQLVQGRVELLATLPNGTRETLAVAKKL